MRKVIYCILFFWLILAGRISGAETIVAVSAPDAVVSAQQKVATTLPITQALAAQLLKDTGAQVVYLPPKRLPVKRIANWLAHKSQGQIDKTGPFQALVTVTSAWPRYDLYGKLRNQNIRLVAIDVAQELNQPGLRIRRAADAGDNQYFWLAPDNLTVMAQILAKDLARLWPEHQAQVQRNHSTLKQAIQRYALAVDQLLMDHDVQAVCLQSTALMPQAEAMFLPVERLSAEKGNACSAQALQLKKLKRGADESQAGLWWLDAADKPLKGDLTVWLKGNLQRLEHTLNDR